MTKDEALRMALNWLVSGNFVYPTALRTAIKEALAEPSDSVEQEPVMEYDREDIRGTFWDTTSPNRIWVEQKREWVGLTGQEKALIASVSLDVHDAIYRANDKLKELNHEV